MNARCVTLPPFILDDKKQSSTRSSDLVEIYISQKKQMSREGISTFHISTSTFPTFPPNSLKWNPLGKGRRCHLGSKSKEMPYFCWAFPINDIMDIAARHQHQQRYTERLEKWPFIELFDGQVLKHLSNVDLLWQKVDKYLKRTKKTQATSRLTLVF